MAKLSNISPSEEVIILTRKEATETISKLTALLAGVGDGSIPYVRIKDSLKMVFISVENEQ